jgi:hypothetical protein
MDYYKPVLAITEVVPPDRSLPDFECLGRGEMQESYTLEQLAERQRQKKAAMEAAKAAKEAAKLAVVCEREE